MKNILIEETIAKYGYNPETLSHASEKLVSCICMTCGVKRELKFRHSHRKCLKCSNIELANRNKEQRSEKLKRFWKENVHPRTGKKHTKETKQKITEAKTGLKLSEETKQKLSEKSKGINNPFYGKKHKEESKRYGKANNRYGKVPSHTKKIWYNNICFRSTWEAKVAAYLDANNIEWTYETDLVECIVENNGVFKEVTYRPDFFLVKEQMYIEVKGYWIKEYLDKFYAAIAVMKFPVEVWDRQVLKEKNIL